MEAPSLRKTRAFVCSKAVLWLDSEMPLKTVLGVACSGAVGEVGLGRVVRRPPMGGVVILPSAIERVLIFAPIIPSVVSVCQVYCRRRVAGTRNAGYDVTAGIGGEQ